MNGHWAGEMVPNAMMGWAQPFQPSVMPFQLPYLPQMPQNQRIPVPGQGPWPPFPNPGQPQFFPPGPPSVSSVPSILPGPPYAGSFPPGPSSVASFPPGPHTTFPAGASSTASTSPFPSGPPSVASLPKAGNTRAWLTPKPKTAYAICDQSIAILEPKPKRIKRSLSPDVTLEVADEETPNSQTGQPQACRLCAPFMPSPPTFARILAQREHAKVHSGQFQKSLADVFPLCFPDVLAPEEMDAGIGREDKEQSLPSNSRSESFDTSLPTPPPPPPPSPPPRTPPPAPIPSTSAAPLTTAAPSSLTAPSSSSTLQTPKQDNVAKLGNEATSLVKKSEDCEVSKEGPPVTADTSGTHSQPSDNQAKDSSTATSSSAKPKSTLKTGTTSPWSTYLAALSSAVKKGGPCFSEQPRRGRKGRLPKCTNAIPGVPALLERHLAKHLGKDLFRCTVPDCPSPQTRYKLQHNKSHPGSPKPDYEDLRPPLARLLADQLERCIGNKGAFKAKESAKLVKPDPMGPKSTQSKTNLNAPTTPKESKKPTVTDVQPPSHTVYRLKNQDEFFAASTFAQNLGLYFPTASEIQMFKNLKPDLFNSDQYHWHNEHPLEVRLRSDCKDVSAFATRKCPSCGRKVSEPTVSAPGDLAILHQERYNRPGGGFWVLTETTGLRVYHAHYACIAGRFPYADLNFLRIKESKSAGNFTSAHLIFLASMFGFLPEP